MREINITRGMTALVDSGDLQKVSAWSWSAMKTRRKDKFYAVATVNNKFAYMHHLILGSTNQVDHKNGNGLDNRRENLRFATPSQNQMNRNKTLRKCTSAHKGVAFREKGRVKHWYAYITVSKKQMSLGYFASEIQAAHAYNEAATKYFGEFAKLNILAEPQTCALVTTPRLKESDELLIEGDINGGQL